MTGIPPFFVCCENPNAPAIGAAGTRKNMATALGAMAALASFEELALSPKPGLVDPDDCGSHGDMTWVTFLTSASVLAPLWREQAMDGVLHEYYKPSDGLYVKLRSRGIEMERKMFAATGGINTHKGLIFALSILLGAAGSCAARRNLSPGKICALASEIARPLVDDDIRRIRDSAKSCQGLTHGERILVEHGIGGIRSEAASGFPSALSALRELEDAVARGASYRDAALGALLLLMLISEDTNIIHRSGIDFWRGEYREETERAKINFDPLQPKNYLSLLELNKFLKNHSASPGGSADLLACTLFLYRSKILGNTLKHSAGRRKR
ncbi:MAG: triphosphoribosyl-dephospho-CoA synthase [Synergistaceae bacterium]|jgi:triphosphoribosyl-dephospho-CoA synthetase|nr:triphosphoribosyl-dephospho-CoA synthase [Synergistaceae bacterium]